VDDHHDNDDNDDDNGWCLFGRWIVCWCEGAKVLFGRLGWMVEYVQGCKAAIWRAWEVVVSARSWTRRFRISLLGLIRGKGVGGEGEEVARSISCCVVCAPRLVCVLPRLIIGICSMARFGI
jgi:hypothetical protein